MQGLAVTREEVKIMRRWKAKLPGDISFEFESDDPGKDLEEVGIRTYALTEITKAEQLALTVKEAAKLLQVSSPTMYELVNRSDFPVIRVGRSIRINREGLRLWLNSNTQNMKALQAGA